MQLARNVIVAILLGSALAARAKDGWTDVIVDDYQAFYFPSTLGRLAWGIGLAGVLANGSADAEFREWY